MEGWKRSDAVVAQRIAASQLGGLFSRKVSVGSGEVAIVEKDGEAEDTLSEGTHKVAGRLSGAGLDVVLIDISPKLVRRDAGGIWTKDDREVKAAVEMRFSVSDPGKLRSLMMGRRDTLVIEDIWKELEKEIVSSSLVPVAKKWTVDELRADRKSEKEVQVAVEVEARKKFEVYGLELLGFSVVFIPKEDYAEYLRSRGRIKEEAEKEGLRQEEERIEAARGRDIDEVSGRAETDESVRDEMERERLRREAEMAIEEEETQQDMEDAVEGLKLKELNDRQKEERQHGLATLRKEFPGRSAEEKYESIKDLIGATEKKYFERKIGKGTFRKLMEEYEKEKTELEVAMKKEGEKK